MNVSPLVSYIIVTYNQERFVKDAVLSALEQTYDNMEIIISDDNSTDKTMAIIQETVSNYKGSHKIIINKNETNLGIREHVNKLLYEFCNGEYILLAAGDDVSKPERTQIYVDYFNKFPEVMSISCKSEEVDIDLRPIEKYEDEWDNSYSIYNKNDYFEFNDFFIYSGDSRGLRRTVIDSFPPLKYPRAEDIYLFVRSVILGSGCYIRMPLVLRRHHEANASAAKTTKEIISNGNLQFEADVNYAYEKGFISETEKQKFMKKIFFYKKYQKTYFLDPKKNIRTFVYLCLRKLFGVTIFR